MKTMSKRTGTKNCSGKYRININGNIVYIKWHYHPLHVHAENHLRENVQVYGEEETHTQGQFQSVDVAWKAKQQNCCTKPCELITNGDRMEKLENMAYA